MPFTSQSCTERPEVIRPFLQTTEIPESRRRFSPAPRAPSCLAFPHVQNRATRPAATVLQVLREEYGAEPGDLMYQGERTLASSSPAFWISSRGFPGCC